MEYFKLRRAKKNAALAEKAKERGEEPVLSEDDQQFLDKVMSSGEDPPPLPTRPQDLPVAGSTITNDAQVALIKDAQDVPLPETPAEPVRSPDTDAEKPEAKDAEGSKEKDKSKAKEKVADNKIASRLSGFIRSASVRRNRDKTAADLHSAAEALRSPTSPPAATEESKEQKKEEEEIAEVLDQLNLAAENNRVFSISDESKELLKKFNLVLKDLINGVPTAYHDLESLLTNSEDQLSKIYESMPSFLKHLVEKLPGRMSEKFTEVGGPELLATAAAKATASSSSTAAAEAASTPLKLRVPSLKELVTKQGAIASLLRGITQFLKARVPAALGVNVLWSMALFVLLLIFWYCHKRGREVRLENERKVTAEEMEALRQKVAAEEPGTYDASRDAESMALTTTAPAGASLEEVQAGVREVQEARRASAAAAAAAAGGGGGQDSTTAAGSGSGTQAYAERGSLAQAVREGEVKGDGDGGTAAIAEGKGKGKGKATTSETAPGSS